MGKPSDSKMVGGGDQVPFQIIYNRWEKRSEVLSLYLCGKT